jgi:hypothetical protein
MDRAALVRALRDGSRIEFARTEKTCARQSRLTSWKQKQKHNGHRSLCIQETYFSRSIMR